MPVMKKLIVANWKMNNSFAETDRWLKTFITEYDRNFAEFENVEPVLCPPVFLIDYVDSTLLDKSFEELDDFLKEEEKDIDDFSEDELADFVAMQRPFELGAQDCHYAENGSYTGDISAQMIKTLNANYVIIGHSERRARHLESDEMIAQKARLVQKNNLTPILCVGENKEVRDVRGHLEFVYKQLMASVPRDVHFPRLVIAYEPIWSIGTGVVPSAAEIKEMMRLLRRICQEKIPQIADEFVLLYGGSVTEQNSASILEIENVDGLLVGKASLDAKKFAQICLS